MTHLISKVLISALSLLGVAYLVPGIDVESVYVAIIAAIILGALNAVVRPILVVLTFPITIVTLGLFIFVINAGLFMLAAHFLDGFSVDDFWAALVGSLLVSLGSTIGNRFIKD